MMRLTWATIVAILISAPSVAQQPLAGGAASPPAAQGAPQGVQGAQAAPAARVAAQAPQTPPQQPFPPLSAAEQAHLTSLLQNWQKQSQGTKTLESKFTRWHFDRFAAPVNVHATRADGVLKYASPDKGLFRVDRLVFFIGMKEGKPEYKEQPGQYGEHWVCNGKQLIEFDRGNEQCRIQDLPPEIQGQQIFNSPLPFVFNLDANRIVERYWVRQVQAPKPGILLVEAWPKRQEDRAQYKLVQIALDAKTFMPQALLMYAPNFDPKTAPKWDHYEFTDVKRNAIGAGLQQFLGNFIPQQPPKTWKIFRDKFTPPVDPPVRRAAAPGARPADGQQRQ